MRSSIRPDSSPSRSRQKSNVPSAARSIAHGRLRLSRAQRVRPRRNPTGFNEAGRGRLSKNPGELERVATLSNFQSRPAACTVGTGRFLRRKISFSRAKIVSLQAPRPKNLRFLAETGEGGSGGGACFPVHQLVKTFFDKLGRRSLLPVRQPVKAFFDKPCRQSDGCRQKKYGFVSGSGITSARRTRPEPCRYTAADPSFPVRRSNRRTRPDHGRPARRSRWPPPRRCG